METSLIGKALAFGSNEYGFESRVSNINYTSSINYLLNHLTFSSKNKKLLFKIQINKKSLKLLFILKKHCIISSFSIIKNKLKRTFVLINPSYNKRLNINFFFKSFFLTNHRLQLSIRALKLIKKRTGNSIYLLSTSYGVIDHFQALENSKSGFLLGVIHS